MPRRSITLDLPLGDSYSVGHLFSDTWTKEETDQAAQLLFHHWQRNCRSFSRARVRLGLLWREPTWSALKLSPLKETPFVSVLADASVKLSGRMSWFALQVRSRRESIVATQLLEQGYECFLPLYKSVRRWSDRMKELEQPLFPGYLFSRFDYRNCRSLLMTPGVQQVLGNGRSPIPVEEGELESIRRVLRSGLPNQPWPYLQVGERVRVNYGSLNNLEGILINFKGSHRVVLSVTLLQRSVAMEVDLAWVTPVRETGAATVSRVFSGQTTGAIALGQ